MKAFLIENDIVAARDRDEAVRVWAEFAEQPINSIKRIEELDPKTMEIAIEEEDGKVRDGVLEEVMPTDADGPQIVCTGECDC